MPLALPLVLPLLVAIGVPLVFLYAVRRLDLYASGGFGVVIRCFLWGFVAFLASYLVNGTALRWFTGRAVRTVVAPVVEEIFKSMALAYYVRRPEFTYFVDGAIYGFATGTAFAIVEALFYLSHASLDGGMALSVNRAFSTSLMHGTTSALVGVAMGRFRFKKSPTRLLALVSGLGMAMALHLTFNWLVTTHDVTTLVLAGAMGLGLGGLATVALLIRQGLREEKQWLRESLGLDVGVSAAESAVIQRLADLDELLAPITQHFGAEKRRQVEAFLRLQAQLGLKSKAQSLSQDARLAAQLGEQVAAMQREMDVLRRTVGVYCMAYVRQILPATTEPVWAQLELALAQATPSGHNVWSSLSDRLDDGVT